MGSVLASRLLQHGVELTVFNRTTSKMEPLLKQGAKGASSAQEAVKNADVVITCLFDDKAVLDVLTEEKGILSGLS